MQDPVLGRAVMAARCPNIAGSGHFLQEGVIAREALAAFDG
jgi:hypothetical protein